jgi:hypothetical protein
MSLETWELLSYVVTVVGLPLAIAVFLYEQRRERGNEEEAVYESLSVRRWASWEDYMREWLARDAFRTQLPELVKGEDPEFAAYIQGLAASFRPALKP